MMKRAILLGGWVISNFLVGIGLAHASWFVIDSVCRALSLDTLSTGVTVVVVTLVFIVFWRGYQALVRDRKKGTV